MKSVEIIGKPLSEAVEEGAAKLGVSLSEVEHEVIDEGSKGFLGLGARPAKIRVFVPGAEDEEEVKPEPAEAKPEPQKAAKEKPVKEKTKQESAVKPEPAETNISEDTQTEASDEEKTERTQLSEEDKAKVADIAEKFLKSVFDTMNIKVDISTEFVDNKQLIVNMSGEEMGVVIGKRGQTLDSLQTLTSLVVNKGELPYVNVTLDTESYRERRKETLERLAFNLAKKCKHNRRNVVLEPMNPYERRIIHSTLQNDKYVTTYSEGVEPHRYVVITMKNNYNRHQQHDK